MLLLTVWELTNYSLVLLYGVLLSVLIAGGCKDAGQRNLVLFLCPTFLLVQSVCALLLGPGMVKKLYPLIIHLPLMLVLVFALKRSPGVAVTSVCTAYLCCQLPRWGNIAVSALTESALAGEIAYTLVIVAMFVLLQRYFVKPANSAMTYSRQSMIFFGSLPAGYYVFDYATTIYSDLLYAGIPALNELIPTMLVLFYVVFLVAYHHETQKRTKAELENAAQTLLFKQAQKEMEIMRQAQMQTAIYRHDMHHHLNMIDVLLDIGKPEQARAYIRKTREDITSIAVKRFCENEPVNLICSSFVDKAARMSVRLSIHARLPAALPISDTELCAILSNSLENALNAVSYLDETEKWIELYCDVKLGNLLIEVKNPFAGTIAMEDDLPVSTEEGHGYGCRSIRTIVLENNGLYTFEPRDGVFTLQVAIPMGTG